MSLDLAIVNAIAAGRCALAVSESLTKDADVALALKQRGALSPMALAGQVVAPVLDVSPAGVARAVQAPKGVLVIVEPGERDAGGLQRLAGLLPKPGPQVFIVGKKPDKFKMMTLFGKVEYIAEAGKPFLAALPLPPAEAPVLVEEGAAATKPAKKATEGGPKFVFAGRDEEVEALAAILTDGGPVVLSGPSGIGRTAIVDHAVAKAGLTRLPDLTLGRGVGADALLARLAEITRAAGAPALAEVLARPHTFAEVLTALTESLQGADLSGHAFVIKGLHVAAGKEGDFFRKSRLELVCEALLTQTYRLRLIFTSAIQPRFYREGRDAALRRMEIGGLKGRFYFDIFDALNAADFSRDKFGPMSERLHGHPVAVRIAAVAIRSNPQLLDDERFLKMADASDTDTLRKQIEKRLEKLPENLRAMLARLAHVRYPVEASVLQDLDISKKDRQALVAEGVLEMGGTEAGKRYSVHPLIRQSLDNREVADFATFAEIARRFKAYADKADGVEKLAWTQEINRCLVEARMGRDLLPTEFPDHDGVVESCIGLLRSKPPRLDIAAARLGDVLKADPSNADAHLLRVELLRKKEGNVDKEIAAALDEAIAAAPVPELFHEAVAFHLARNNRNKAIKVLESAIEALPDHSRLRTRLASLLLRAGRRPEAIEHLKEAMTQDPMLPDAYGLLGMARREEGVEKLDEAETMLREAVRLAPHDIVQTSRLVWLLLEIAQGVPERTASAREEVKALIDGLLAHDKRSHEAHLLYAVALREEGGDLDRAAWFLKQARKLAPATRSGPPPRFEMEEALLDLARGKLDDAEGRLRRLEKKDPTNHRVFAALGRVLEARGQLVAAFHETRRAADRCAPNSLDRAACDLVLARLQAAIEAGAGVIPEHTPDVIPDAPVADDEHAALDHGGAPTYEGEPAAEDAEAPSEEPPSDEG
jgi:tetratricopeptide (TPR) repeat protein